MKNWQKCAEKLREQNIHSFIVLDVDHIRYLTGLIIHERFDAISVLTQSDCWLITDFRYEENTLKLAKKFYFQTIVHSSSKISSLVNLLKDKFNIGLDPDETPVSLLDKIKQGLKQNRFLFNIQYLPNWMDKICEVKEKSEIENIEKALKITEHVFEKHVLPIIKAGVKETDLAAEITYQHLKHGAESDAFSPIVLSGSRSSLPHGLPTDKKIAKGDIVQFDIGCKYNGYCSDFSRAVILGKPSSKQKKIYDAVLKAQKEAVKKIEVGAKCRALDSAARNIIQEAGYGEMAHGLGHGVGMKIHMLPFISPKNTDGIVKNGHVFTVEPGIYIPNWGGVRIEDMIAIIDNKVEVLTKTTKKLLII